MIGTAAYSIMHKFQIEPHLGIGPIQLGVSRTALQVTLASIGFPLERTHGRLDYFCEAAIQVEYDEQWRSKFIGVSCHQAYSVFYSGVNVFDKPAADLFALIAGQDGSGSHIFCSNGYTFPNQMLTLWDADSQYDRLGGELRIIWAQVGIGVTQPANRTNLIS